MVFLCARQISATIYASPIMTVSNQWQRLLPYCTQGHVVRGFGRGGKQLNCPTANLDDGAVQALPVDFPCGVYYGWATVGETQHRAHPMVMSIGYNPQFKNTVKTIEAHILHEFKEDFYGSWMKLVVVGRMREMMAFNGLDELTAAIEQDKRDGHRLLQEPEAQILRDHKFFLESAV